MADSFAETPEGLLLIANGFDPVLRWDGLGSIAETAGVGAPEAAVVVAGNSNGPIVGTYFAFMRYVDRLGNLSNLSPISNEYEAVGGTGTITAASNATPIVITSTAHGLATGDVVKIEGVGGNTSANNTWTITVLTANTFSLDGSTGTATYNGGGTWTSGVDEIAYSNLETPTDPKIRRRQILRNSDGQADVFYVDIDTDDLSSTSLTSNRLDVDLVDQEAQPLLDTDGRLLANRYFEPPTHKAVLAHHLNRMFAAVEYDYVQGSAKVTFGSATVEGVGTEWSEGLIGRRLYVTGAADSYLIEDVDVSAQTLTLEENYQDSTDEFAIYAIRPAPGESRLIYYSESGLPEAWPPTNTLSIQEDGDDITGLIRKGSFVYILERRHIYRHTFQSDPAVDGAVFLSVNRGCVTQRCAVEVEGVSYMLDEEGVHAFDGGSEAEAIGINVQNLFRPGEDGPYKINWQARQYFHASHFAAQQTIRWFVSMAGNTLPRHAIALNYRLRRWWIEEYRVPIGAACAGNINESPRVFIGSSSRRVFSFWEGTLDGPVAGAGTTRGVVTSASTLSLTDTTALFATDGIVGSPVAIVDGLGRGQMRMIVEVSGTTLYLDLPWQVLPDTTSYYQIGGIPWLYRSTWFPYVISEEHNERRFQLLFQPTRYVAALDMRLRSDFAASPSTWSTDVSSAQGDGVRTEAGIDDLRVDLMSSRGVVQKRFSGHREMYTSGRRYAQVELAGFTHRDLVRVFEISFDGVVAPNQGR